MPFEKGNTCAKGRIPWNKGKKHSEETKRKISATSKGRIFSETARAKMRANHKGFSGKSHSKEARKRIGDACRGDKSHWWKGGIASNRKEYKRFMQARRRARKANNGGSHSLREWMELKRKHNYSCVGCGRREPKIRLQEDHIVPISKGGKDNIQNIQPLCGECNRRKYNHAMGDFITCSV